MKMSVILRQKKGRSCSSSAVAMVSMSIWMRFFLSSSAAIGGDFFSPAAEAAAAAAIAPPMEAIPARPVRRWRRKLPGDRVLAFY